jgi:hypothetical protein
VVVISAIVIDKIMSEWSIENGSGERADELNSRTEQRKEQIERKEQRLEQ